jgi:hypothetical protein
MMLSVLEDDGGVLPECFLQLAQIGGPTQEPNELL